MTFLTGTGPSSSLITDPVSGDRYFLTLNDGTWEECQFYAENWGGDLVTINSAQQELWLQQQYGSDEPYWIGFNDIAQEGVWEWVNGDPITYENWAPGEPNDLGGEDVAVMNSNAEGQWSSVPRDYYYRGIAMVPAGVPIPPDDHGNTFDQATHIIAPGTISGQLSYHADIDLFIFDDSAGQA